MTQTVMLSALSTFCSVASQGVLRVKNHATRTDVGRIRKGCTRPTLSSLLSSDAKTKSSFTDWAAVTESFDELQPPQPFGRFFAPFPGINFDTFEYQGGSGLGVPEAQVFGWVSQGSVRSHRSFEGKPRGNHPLQLEET